MSVDIDEILERHRRQEEMQRRESESSGDALLSGLIAYGTNSAIAGSLLGGSVTGAVLGDLFNGGDLFD